MTTITTEIEILILIIGWILGHLVLWGILSKQLMRASIIGSMLLLGMVYALKPATGDLWSYSFFFDTGYQRIYHEAEKQRRTEPSPAGYSISEVAPDFRSGVPYLQRYATEPLFAWMIKGAATVLPQGSKWPRFQALGFRAISDFFLVFVVGLGLALIWLAAFLERVEDKHKSKNSYLFIKSLPFILGSVFFFVGSQNSIRQFLMLTCCMLFCVCLKNRRYFLVVLFGIAAMTVHNFGFIFILILMWAMIVPQQIHHRLFESKGSIYLAGILVGTISGCALAVGIKLAVWGGVQEIAQYVFLEDSEYWFRTAAVNKLALIAIYVMVVEVIAARSTSPVVDYFRYLRLTIFSIVAPLVIYPEIFSRLLFLYYLVELFFIVFAITSGVRRYMVSALAIVSVYSFAPNVLNILVGKGWLEVLGNAYL